MTIKVVDCLEVVDIEQDEGRRLLVPLAAGDGVGGFTEQRAATTRSGQVIVGRDLAQLEFIDHEPAEFDQQVDLRERKVPRLVVERAQRADVIPITGDERCPGIADDVRRPDDERIGFEPRIVPRIDDDHRLARRDHVGAE